MGIRAGIEGNSESRSRQAKSILEKASITGTCQNLTLAPCQKLIQRGLEPARFCSLGFQFDGRELTCSQVGLERNEAAIRDKPRYLLEVQNVHQGMKME